MALSNFIGNSNLIWLPIVAFILILLFAIATGFYKGWKTALYYLVFDWIATLIGIFVTGPILVAISDQLGTNQVDVAQYAANNPILAPLLMILWIPALRLISMPIHVLFLRKSFRQELVNNEVAAQVNQASLRTRFWKLNGRSRLLGASLSFLGAAPMAIFTANAAMFLSGDNFFSPLNEALVTATTFNLYESAGKHAASTRDYFVIVNNNEINLMRRLLVGERMTLAELEPAYSALSNVLTSDANSLKGAISSLPQALIDVQFIKAILASPQGLSDLPRKFSVTQGQFDTFKAVLSDNFKWDELSQVTNGWAKVQAAYFSII